MRISRVVTVESNSTQTEEKVMIVREHVDKCIQTINNISDSPSCSRGCQFDLNDIREMDKSNSNENQEITEDVDEEEEKEEEDENEDEDEDEEIENDIDNNEKRTTTSDEALMMEHGELETIKYTVHYKCLKCHKCLVCREIKRIKEIHLKQQQQQQKEKEKEKITKKRRETANKEKIPSTKTKIDSGSTENNVDTANIPTIYQEHIACECNKRNQDKYYSSSPQLNKKRGPVAMLRKEKARYHSDHQLITHNNQPGKNGNTEMGSTTQNEGNNSSARSLKYYEVGENGIGSFSCDSILVVSPATARAISAEGKELRLRKGSVKKRNTPLRDEIRNSDSKTNISSSIPSQISTTTTTTTTTKLKKSISQGKKVIKEEENIEYNDDDEEEEEEMIMKSERTEKGKRESYENENNPDYINTFEDYTSEIDIKDENGINSSNPNTAYSRTTTSSSNHSRYHSHGSSHCSKKKKSKVTKAKSTTLNLGKSPKKSTPPSDQEYFKSHCLGDMKGFNSTPVLNNIC
ncbi:hypothetical protein PIROE2DRAFT_9999 [Piromyces sp. E2]|nr:hypothetical protein PIROE2DRAFT_9999 [Piromyces sp. E2]|eukprot:OUM63454.1 hypothetical protein PIROE2DRAFT_9999 [Piromyces sp. E2]